MNPNPDPYVMYLVVKKSLAMGAGKLAGQVGHAVQEIVHEYFVDNGTEIDPFYWAAFRSWMYDDWRAYAKVVLGASDAEFDAVKTLDTKKHVVEDRGFTANAPGTETVIGLWPMKKSQAPEIIRNLKLLK